MTRRPVLAIVSPNVLTGMGLKALLEKIIPAAEVVLFTDFAAFAETGPEGFAHFFVAARLFPAHAAFFREQRRKTILLTDAQPCAALAGMHALDVCTSEERLVHDILLMHRGGHPQPHTAAPDLHAAAPLTPREKEVLALIARGFTSRQIAAQLRIALTTVTSHRRNLTGKLGVRSVAELVLAAVTAGYVGTEPI